MLASTTVFPQSKCLLLLTTPIRPAAYRESTTLAVQTITSWNMVNRLDSGVDGELCTFQIALF